MPRVEVVMPKIGLTVEEATVSEWLVPEGTEVAAGEPILEIDTDKATNEIEAPRGGVLVHAVEVKQTIRVGQVVAYLETAEN